MATHKLSDLLQVLQTAAKNDQMASVGIAPPLVKVVIDLITDKSLKPESAMTEPEQLQDVLFQAHDADTHVTVTLAPGLATLLIAALDENIRLHSMEMFIAEQLPSLNPARGHNPTSDKAIDEITRAIAARNDPTANIPDEPMYGGHIDRPGAPR